MHRDSPRFVSGGNPVGTRSHSEIGKTHANQTDETHAHALKPPAKGRLYLFDPELPGVVVTDNGTCTFFVQ
jgi:hypothetical protein